MRHVFLIGSNGIPASYGGFETFVEQLTAHRKDQEIFYHGSKISRNYWLFEPKCRNNAEITYTQRLQIASYFP